MDPIRVPPDLPEGGLSPEELEMLMESEPLAGPLPVEEGGEILEPMALPVPERPSPPGETAEEREPVQVQVRGESFWSFGEVGPPPRRVDGWTGQ